MGFTLAVSITRPVPRRQDNPLLPTQPRHRERRRPARGVRGNTELSSTQLPMSRALGTLVDLREGERPAASRAFVLLALIIGGHTLLETARDALFLGTLPANRLAIVYALIAGLALIVTGPTARLAQRLGEGRAVCVTLIAAACGTMLLFALPMTGAVVFVVYVWSAFLGTVMVIQLWLFLARVFTPTQGKRLFGPIAAGGVAGAIAGAGGAAM